MMRRGFTLLEILLATAVLTILLGVVWTTKSLLVRMEIHRAQNEEQQRIVRTWTRTFNEDFRPVIQDTDQLDRDVGSETVQHFGVSGTGTQLRIDISDYSWRTAQSSELRTIFYEFHPTYGLIRRERDYAAPASAAWATQIASEIVSGTFRYFDGGTWHEHWSSLDRKSAPSAVEVTFYSLSRSEETRWRNQESDVQEPRQTRLEIPVLAATRGHEPFHRAQPPPPVMPQQPPPAMYFPAPPPPPTMPPPSPTHSLFGGN